MDSSHDLYSNSNKLNEHNTLCIGMACGAAWILRNKGSGTCCWKNISSLINQLVMLVCCNLDFLALNGSVVEVLRVEVC